MKPLDDRIYRICLNQARSSPCKGVRSGAVLTDDRWFFTIADRTRSVGELSDLCATLCRGTDGHSSACSLAEEWVIWQAIHNGIKLNRHYLYIADIDGEGRPKLREQPYFRCMRSALMIHHSEIRMVSVAGIDEQGVSRWIQLSPADCLRMAREHLIAAEVSDTTPASA